MVMPATLTVTTLANCPARGQLRGGTPSAFGVSSPTDDGTRRAPDGCMALHDSMTIRIDAPTIAFERQVTTSFPAGAFGEELFDAATVSTMSPVVRPMTLTERRWSRPAREGHRWVLYLLCMAIGVAAGHVVRERQAYATRAMSVVEALQTPKVSARFPRQADVMGVRETNLSLPRPKAGSPSPMRRASSRAKTTPAPAVMAHARSSSVETGNAMLVEFELDFRAPE